MTANVVVQEMVRKVEQSRTTDSLILAREWRTALTEARDILRFEPISEAPLPQGFPKPTPVGEIRIQHYPRYRLARTETTLSEGQGFWTLFAHIQRHEIAMTAPVEMTYPNDRDKNSKKAAMSFLYRSPELGQLGTEGKVEVVDIPPQTAISIGLRGEATSERVADANRRLESWLEAHHEEYERSGVLRVMGYNSPFVADQKRFTEVQIPINAKRRSSAITP